MNKEYYDDWFSDNKESLIDEFIEEHYEEFRRFCDEEFNIFMEER